ncbi:MAG: hypothetical protein JSS82_01040 [Bacteroidetes bacterium]|nr:hypothetical protein [Bacteroidota bacterium]
MMKYIFTISFLLLFTKAYSQNLVHNPSFELNTTCPSDTNDFNLALEWVSIGQGADLFDSCCNGCQVDVPDNCRGSQLAFTGQSYAGIYIYKEDFSNYRCYIKGNLDTLISGHWYRVKMRLSGSSKMQYECGCPGVFFYTNQNIQSSNQLLPFSPQIRNNFQIGNDTTNWIVANNIFFADSAYTQILIGNFNDDLHSAVDHLAFNYPNTPESRGAYTYIDEISVTDITAAYIAGLETEPINVNTYPNPFTSYTNISIDAGPHQRYTLRLYNMQGALLRELNDIKGNNVILQREDLP